MKWTYEPRRHVLILRAPWGREKAWPVFPLFRHLDRVKRSIRCFQRRQEEKLTMERTHSMLSE